MGCFALIPYSPHHLPTHWRFDWPSAIIGAAVALLLAWLLYAFRDALRRAWEAVLVPLRQLSHYLLAGAEETYREQVVARMRSLIVPGHAVLLDAVFVEPELTIPLPSPKSLSEMEAQAGSYVLPLRKVFGRHPQLLILGAPGAGKTTVLAYLALACARAEEDMPQAIQGRLPLYVSLPALDWKVTEETGKRDGQSRLIAAALAMAGGSSGMERPLRKYLEAGKAIVLADGWDELSPPQRQQAAAWLTELIGALPGNLWLAASGMRDYALLAEAGFVPLTLTEWNAKQVEILAQHWLEAYIPKGESPPIAPRELIADLRRAARLGFSPLELSLRAFVYLHDRKVPAGRAAVFDRALDLLLRQEQKQAQEEDPTLLVACRTALGQVALRLQQEHRTTVSREEIEAGIEAVLPPPEERPPSANVRVFRALTGNRGLLLQVGSNRYALVHPLWQAYLAARQLVALAPTTFVERLDDPYWSDVLRFYAELGDMGPLVAAWLRTPDDMFHTRLRTLGDWIGMASEGAAWRDGAMAVLARAFLQLVRFAPIRQALARALATSGIPGVTYFLKQALQHPDAEIRIAAIWGLARVAGEAELPIFEAVMRDQDPAVREQAVHALASLGIDAATRLLEQVILEADDALKLVAAEALAKCGDEGEQFLRELIGSDDLVLRRAAVVGLAQIGAQDILERVAREDDQWIVRAAAAAALEELEKRRETVGVDPPPVIEQLPWLITWAASLGEGVGLGEAARLMLRRALSEGAPPIRLAAARTLVQAGRPDDVDSLHAALADPDPDVVRTAFEALAEIGRRYGLKIERASPSGS